MDAGSQRAWQVRSAYILILGLAAAAACVLALIWWKAPAASAQESTGDASFVVRCDFSHRKQVDPIVSFGGTSHHMHDFFGNKTTDASSTLESLRAGGTTCTRAADKAAYWIPTVKWTDSRGTRNLKANKGLFYYRAAGKVSGGVEPHPLGLKVVTAQGKRVEWRCANGTWSKYPPTRCSNGKLVVRIKFPFCSDGNLDSADHRSHMAYPVRKSDGTLRCSNSHPITLPRLQMNAQFPIPTTSGRVTLASGSYSTMHADFFNAWEEGRLAELVEDCINAAPFTTSNPKPAECQVTGT
ncbi:MAG: DUF1996 domain-containing protein [Actinomycetota bacterium]|nr:DUF1996 domain-containing protein [Actinomycetota bacterium]